jgi:hypothetical protein
MHRLREKLGRYYELEGSRHKVKIVLPVGSYVPQFVPNTEAEEKAAGEPSETRSSPPHSLGQARSKRAARLRARTVVALASLAIVVVALLLWRLYDDKSVALTAPSLPSAAQSTLPASSVEQGVRILAGNSKANFIDRSGHVWMPDQYFQRGSAAPEPRGYIARAPEISLFQAARVGEFSYEIPLPPGVYEMRLYFAETFFGPDQPVGGGETSRIFHIEMNGAPLLSDFDPYRDAGGNYIAHVRAFKDVVPGPDGLLRLRFLRLRDSPFINAIEIVPGTPGKLLPVRIVAQEHSYTDRRGSVWMPDRYFRGGRVVRRKISVSNTEEPDLYAGERYGNFSYSIPVAPGRYTVRLHFAEAYFGTEVAGFGGGGDRVFSVLSNGQFLLKDFDIFREAGGPNRALVKTFRGLEPNAAGQILLEFIPIRNYACVNALEVLSE